MTRGPTRRMLPVLVAAGMLPLLSPALGAVPFDPAYNPHASFRDPSGCHRCHPVVGGKTVSDRLRPGSVDFCVGCHANGSLGRLSHPVGGRPRDAYKAMRIPDEFRLDDDGRLTCLSCHSAHGPRVAAVKAYASQEPENPDAPRDAPRYYKTRYLRRTDPARGYAVLCYACHATP